MWTADLAPDERPDLAPFARLAIEAERVRHADRVVAVQHHFCLLVGDAEKARLRAAAGIVHSGRQRTISLGAVQGWLGLLRGRREVTVHELAEQGTADAGI